MTKDEAFERKVAELAKQDALAESETFEREVSEMRGQCERVEAVMCRLPLLPDSEKFTGDFAGNVVLAAQGHYPVSRGHKAAIDELDKLRRHLVRTQKLFAELSFEADEALKRVGAYQFVDEGALVTCARRVDVAKEGVKAVPDKKRAGRPLSRREAEVAREALRAYETLTGKKAGVTTSPTDVGHPRSGEFLTFVTEIFEACEIEASADNQAKKTLRTRPPSYHEIKRACDAAFSGYVPPDPSSYGDPDVEREHSRRVLEMGKAIEAMLRKTPCK